jgi:hypothetical protein
MRSAVAIFFFRRPKMLSQVFAAVRRARPPRLFLVADGPRLERPAEAAEVLAARKVVQKIGWPCKVERIYAEHNLGCGTRISSGLNEVFKRVPEAVVLEDDTLPVPDFFRFMDLMLAKYRHDERVGCVCGVRVPTSVPSQGVVRFSRYPAVWGWGSWARFWRHYQFRMNDWIAPGGRRPMQAILGEDAKARAYWSQLFWRAGLGIQDTWDYQMTEALWRSGSLAAHSTAGLVRNIGAGDATHPDSDPDPEVLRLALGRLPARLLLPRTVVQDLAFDLAVENRHYSGRCEAGVLRSSSAWMLNILADMGLMRSLGRPLGALFKGLKGKGA